MSTTNVTPVIAQLAARLGVNMSNVVGTGVGGRIRREDVLNAAQPGQGPSMARAGTSRPRPAGNPYARGDSSLPAFTASGLDPAALLGFPAPVRAAMAAVPSQAEAYSIGQRYQGLSDLDAARAMVSDPSLPASGLNAAHALVAAADNAHPFANGQSCHG